MKNKDYFSIGLPKWPALVVKGKSVSREQAKEILIRTDSLYFTSNDHAFVASLNEILYDLDYVEPKWNSQDKAIASKLGVEENDYRSIYEYRRKSQEAVGYLKGLNYLHNHRIVSSWIGGPQGWCDWEGNIFTRNYNIGKWPSVKDVYEEWKIIAKTFPYLELTAQLFNGEAGEDKEDFKPVVEYKVKNGKVRMKVPKEPLDTPQFGVEDMVANLFSPGRERGCTLAKFKEAIEYNREKNGPVAQLEEHQISNLTVASSSLARVTNFKK